MSEKVCIKKHTILKICYSLKLGTKNKMQVTIIEYTIIKPFKYF